MLSSIANIILGVNGMRRITRRSKRSHRMITDIPLTPLIDTALTLLIIFMVTTPMMHNVIKVQLPQGKAQEDKGGQQEVVVYVDKEGKLFVNGTLCATDVQVIDDVKTRIGAEHNKTVYIKADKDANYGTVITLVDKIKTVGGVKYVALATAKYT